MKFVIKLSIDLVYSFNWLHSTADPDEYKLYQRKLESKNLNSGHKTKNISNLPPSSLDGT